MTVSRFTRTSQPQTPVGIDWSNPLCKGLAFVSVGDNPVSLVTGGVGTLVGTVSKTVGRMGKCLQTVHGAANRIDYANGCIPSTNGEISFGSVFMSVADTGALQYLINRDAFQNLFTLRSASMYLQITWNGVGIVYGTVPAVAGAWNVGSGSSPTVGNTTGGKIYINGNNGIQSSTAGAIGSAGSPIVLLNGRVSDNLRQLNGAQALSVSWNRVLSDSEHLSFYANPWQLFTPISRPIFVGTSATVVSIIGRPNSDILTTGWTGSPDNVSLFTNINESVASDTSYIKSPVITGLHEGIWGFDLARAAGTWDVAYRADFEGASAQVRVSLLDASNVVQGVSSWQTVTSTFALYTATITTTGTAVRVKIEVQ